MPLDASAGDSGAPDPDDAGTPGDPDASEPDAGSEATVTAMVGPEGGTVAFEDTELVIPEGALEEETAITITRTTLPVPEGYRAFSSLYRFEPAGLEFSEPVEVVLPSDASGSDQPFATLFWSRRPADGTGYERLGGVPGMGNVRGNVEHFSFGFIADGVDYTDPPDRSCVRTRMLDTRTVDPGGLAVFFTMDDCLGRPITDVVSSELEVRENDVRVPSEAGVGLFELRALRVFITLAVDVSASTQPIIDEVIDAAVQFVDTLADPSRGLEGRVSVALRAFGGEADAGFTTTHSPNLARVRERLEELRTYSPPDASSTNLHGALVASLEESDRAQAVFQRRNRGGAFTAGYVVAFTDGLDTAGRVTLTTARTAIEESTDDTIAVGLDGADYDPVGLRSLVGNRQVVDAAAPGVLLREFAAIAARVSGQIRRTYLLGYCSPKRSGMHSVTVGLAGATNQVIGDTPSFSADGFDGTCMTSSFDPAVACVDRECGGLGCGACDFCTLNGQCGEAFEGRAVTAPSGLSTSGRPDYNSISADGQTLVAQNGSAVEVWTRDVDGWSFADTLLSGLQDPSTRSSVSADGEYIVLQSVDVEERAGGGMGLEERTLIGITWWRRDSGATTYTQLRNRLYVGEWGQSLGFVYVSRTGDAWVEGRTTGSSVEYFVATLEDTDDWLSFVPVRSTGLGHAFPISLRGDLATVSDDANRIYAFDRSGRAVIYTYSAASAEYVFDYAYPEPQPDEEVELPGGGSSVTARRPRGVSDDGSAALLLTTTTRVDLSSFQVSVSRSTSSTAWTTDALPLPSRRFGSVSTLNANYDVQDSDVVMSSDGNTVVVNYGRGFELVDPALEISSLLAIFEYLDGSWDLVGGYVPAGGRAAELLLFAEGGEYLLLSETDYPGFGNQNFVELRRGASGWE
jgi:hypothetical protein